MRLFALHGSRVLGENIATFLDRSLDPLEERNFEDGEHKIRPLVSVRDQDVYVIHSLHSGGGESVNDKLCKLLFLIAALKDDGAARVTAVVPYLCYARKDRRTKARDPVTMRYVAALFEAVNTDRVVTIDVHNLQAYQNAFRCKTEHLEAQKLFVNYFQSILDADDEVVVMSPDIGGIKRAELFRDRIFKATGKDIGFAFMEKMRSKGVVTGETVVGDVKDKVVIILDDLINSGATMARAASACTGMGAITVYGAATHGVFVEKTSDVINSAPFKKVVVTNTVFPSTPASELKNDKVVVLDTAPVFAETIRRLNTAGSLVSLMEVE